MPRGGGGVQTTREVERAYAVFPKWPIDRGDCVGKVEADLRAATAAQCLGPAPARLRVQMPAELNEKWGTAAESNAQGAGCLSVHCEKMITKKPVSLPH